MPATWYKCLECNKTRKEDSMRSTSHFKPDPQNEGEWLELGNNDKRVDDADVWHEGCCWECSVNKLGMKEPEYKCVLCHETVKHFGRSKHIKKEHRDLYGRFERRNVRFSDVYHRYFEEQEEEVEQQ